MINLNKFTASIVLVFFLSFKLNAAVINEISINGNERISDETIKVYGGININDNIDENKINDILNDLYSPNFFENVEVKEINGVLQVTVEEYPVVNQLLIEGEPSKRIQEKIENLISTKQKQSFIKSNISQDINLIKNLYSSIGYNFTNIEVNIKEIDKKNFDVLLEIDKGEITRISSINFIGDKKIRNNRLRNIIASEKDQFWKFLSKNTRFSKNLVDLDIRFRKLLQIIRIL